MKKIILTVLAGFFATIAVNGQQIPEKRHEGHKPHSKERSHHKKQMTNLNLSEEQKVKIQALNKEHHQQLAELKKQDNITVKESREKMEMLRKKHHTKMQAMLTPEQIARMKENQKNNRSEMDGKRNDKMKTELGLSKEQSAKLDNNRKEMGLKMKAIRENNALSEEQKKEEMKELHKMQKENMKSILTEEQIKRLKERKSQRSDGEKRKTEKKQTI